MKNNKAKDIYLNNLAVIRDMLNFTQEQMAEMLGVSREMYRNYERGLNPLPLARALLVANEFNCSIDYIYRLSDKDIRTDQFMVDIRDIISFENNTISIKISDSYWKYLSERNNILNSNDSTGNKKNNISKLDSQYSSNNNSVLWKSVIEIDKGEFGSFYKSGDSVYPCHFEDNNGNEINISEKDAKEAKGIIDFFSSLRRFIKLP